MAPERNAPCPCGSGKKYKKCCGQTAALPATPPADYASLNHGLAYQGELGRRRETFCREYTALKQVRLRAIERKLTEAATEAGQTVSCGAGCAHCCNLFVVASLQECETIVYQLYHDEAALQNFVSNFPRWQQRIIKMDRTFRRINEFLEGITAGTATAEERQLFGTECDVYAHERVPCPLQKDGLCTVYTQRPYVCAEVVAVTPREWCAPDHPDHASAAYRKATLQMETDMPYFALPPEAAISTSMPFMVNRLLHEGWGALDSIPGMEGISAAHENDPTVRAARRDADRQAYYRQVRP